MNTILFHDKAIKPSKIICVGRNYVEHIEELNNSMPDSMVVFNKPNASLTSKLSSYHQEPLHYEAEICFIVENNKLSAVGFGLDLTKRELQSKLKDKGLPWERAKAFDGAAVFSEFVELENNDWQQLSIELWIDGELIQTGNVNQMLYSPDTILQELNSYTKLEDGDLIMTGTPKGVGVVKKGAKFTGKIFNKGHCIIEQTWIAQ